MGCQNCLDFFGSFLEQAFRCLRDFNNKEPIKHCFYGLRSLRKSEQKIWTYSIGFWACLLFDLLPVVHNLSDP